ncbi:ATP-grasp domain-containing protein [Nannocystaceae bacterium ST9]
MRVALPTRPGLPTWEIDDRFLHAALTELGVEFDRPVWSDPAIDWSGYDLVLIRTTWDYQDHIAEFLAWAERVAACTRLLNPFPVVRWNTHKSYLRELEREGVPLAPSLWLERGRPVELAARVAERGWSRGFIKPLLGATARETLRFRIDVPEQLAAAQAHVDRLVLGQNEDLVVQPYLDAVEREGELSAIWFRGRLSHGVRKVPVAGDYRVQDDFGAHDEPWTLDADALALCERAFAGLDRVLTRLGVAGPLLYARVDMLRTNAGELVLNELELVEPSLFLRHRPAAGRVLAEALIADVA